MPSSFRAQRQLAVRSFAAFVLAASLSACMGVDARPCYRDIDCHDDEICVGLPQAAAGTCVLPETVDAGPRPRRDGGPLADGGVSLLDAGFDAGLQRADGGATCPPIAGSAGDNESGGRCNDTFASAETVEYGGVVNGTVDAIDGGGISDRDMFRFNAASGDLVQIRVAARSGSTVQPYFVLYNADGDRYYNGPLTGATGTVTGQYFVDVGGTFYVEVSDLRHHAVPFQAVGGSGLGYRFEITRVPLAAATAVALPFSTGTITLPANRVLPAYKFDAVEGSRIVAETTAVRLSPPSQLDTVLRLINISGAGPVQVVDVQDDIDFAAGNKDARIDIIAPATGTYVVLVDDISFPEAATRTLAVTINATPPSDGGAGQTSSMQLQAIRTAADNQPAGGTTSLAVGSAVVTYVKPAVAGAGSADAPGFFVQAQASGPAVFVAIDPATLSPPPVAGDTVAFTATRVDRLLGVRRVTALTGFSRPAQGADLTGLMQNVSNVSFLSTTALDALESELVLLSGTVVGEFVASGAGFVSASFATFGTFEPGDRLKLRVPTTLRDSASLARGCRLTLTRVPLWRRSEGAVSEAQPSAWRSSDLTTVNCTPPDGGR